MYIVTLASHDQRKSRYTPLSRIFLSQNRRHRACSRFFYWKLSGKFNDQRPVAAKQKPTSFRHLSLRFSVLWKVNIALSSESSNIILRRKALCSFIWKSCKGLSAHWSKLGPIRKLITCLSLVHIKSAECKKYMYMTFIDYEKVFDSTKCQEFWTCCVIKKQTNVNAIGSSIY